MRAAIIVPRAVVAAAAGGGAEPMIRPIETSLPSFISRGAGIFSESCCMSRSSSACQHNSGASFDQDMG